MANPFTEPNLSGYNSSPPPDDDSQTAANAVSWAKHINKIGDPLKDYSDAIKANITTAFGKRFGNAVTSISTNTNLASAHEGRVLSSTNAITLTLLAAATATSGFTFAVYNADTSGNDLTIDGDSSETINGSVTITIKPNESAIIICNGSSWTALINKTPSRAPDTLQRPILSLDTDTDHDINVTAGKVLDSTGEHILELTSEITKQLDATWAAGDDAGGLNSTNFGELGSAPFATARYTVHVFIIGNTDGTTDVGFDDDLTATNLLADSAVSAAGYTLYRRIGSLLLDASDNWIAFTQAGDRFYVDAYEYDSGAIATTPGTDFTVGCPVGIEGLEVLFSGAIAFSGSATSILAQYPTNTDVEAFVARGPVGETVVPAYVFPVDSNGQYTLVRSGGTIGATLVLEMYGWIDKLDLA